MYFQVLRSFSHIVHLFCFSFQVLHWKHLLSKGQRHHRAVFLECQVLHLQGKDSGSSGGGLRHVVLHPLTQSALAAELNTYSMTTEASCRDQPSERRSGVLSVSRPKRAVAAAREADGRHLLGWGCASDRVRKWGCSCDLCTCVWKLWGCVRTCVCMSVCEGRGV